MQRKLPPDTRLSWRDPNMPVLRDYRMANGEIRITIDPDYEHRYREMLINTSSNLPYHCDPTYHLRRNRKATS